MFTVQALNSDGSVAALQHAIIIGRMLLFCRQRLWHEDRERAATAPLTISYI